LVTYSNDSNVASKLLSTSSQPGLDFLRGLTAKMELVGRAMGAREVAARQLPRRAISNDLGLLPDPFIRKSVFLAAR